MKRAWIALLLACDVTHAAAPPIEIDDSTQHAFSQPVPGLSAAERAQFFVGNSYFNQNWIGAPGSVDTRDGLGPLFNARSCSGCHFKDGRGQPPPSGEPARSMLVRISAFGRPEPTYGDQIQSEAVAGARKEADVRVSYQELPGRFADGEAYSLRKPTLHLDDAGYGPFADGLQTSARVAPALIGLGLLEAVSDSTLLAHADPYDRDRDGISGRANRHGKLGRFGWKAEQASVLEQTAGAFLGDMGLTSRLHTRENQQSAQGITLPSGGDPELSDQVLDSVVFYSRVLAVPKRRPGNARGEALFASACAACHVPTLTTARDVQPLVLADRKFAPYTDLLLHDMGAGLDDGRAVHEAQGSEWRTPPLWGIGLVARVNGHTQFLHDGRARNLSEAILWHDGEGARAKRAFVEMSRAERQALLAFVESL